MARLALHGGFLAPTLLALVLGAAPAHAAITWTGDFETNDLKQWNEQQGPVATRVTLVGDPVRQGQHAARFEIHAEDLGSSSLNRVELGHHPDVATFENSERYYAWSVQLPKAFVAKKAHQITYFESAPPASGPSSGMNIYHQSMQFAFDAEQLSFSTEIPTFMTRWTGPITPGAWHDFVLHVKWSTDAAVGLVGLWVDGVEVVPTTPVQTMYTLDGTPQSAPLPNFMHQGIFRGSDAIADVEVMFLDNSREATTLADVLPPSGGTGGGAGNNPGGAAGVGGNGGSGGTNTGGTTASGGSSGGTGPSSGGQANQGGALDVAGQAGKSSAGSGPAPASSGCGCTVAGLAGERVQFWPLALLTLLAGSARLGRRRNTTRSA